MAKKPLGKDQFGIQKVMRGSDYFADSMGQFALNAISGMVGQLTYFYTDKAGLAAGMVATVFMVTKIIDAFTDIIMGNIIDHTKPGKERYRPWILKMAIPAALMMLLLFTVPKGSAGLQIAYMLVTNLLMTSVIYTAIAIPYASLQVVRTNSSEERGKMGVYRALAGYVPGMAIVLAVIPITNALGGTQSAWIKFAAAVALIVALCLLLCYKKSKETATADGVAETPAEENELDEAIPLSDAIGKLFGNKYWVLALIMGLMSNVTYGLANSSGTYYCKWIYGDDNLVAILGAAWRRKDAAREFPAGDGCKYPAHTQSHPFLVQHDPWLHQLLCKHSDDVPARCDDSHGDRLQCVQVRQQDGGLLAECDRVWRQGRERTWRGSGWLVPCARAL